MTMQIISGQADICLKRAGQCRTRADDPTTAGAARVDYLDLETRWRRLAESYQLAERISSHLAWSAKWVP